MRPSRWYGTGSRGFWLGEPVGECASVAITLFPEVLEDSLRVKFLDHLLKVRPQKLPEVACDVVKSLEDGVVERLAVLLDKVDLDMCCHEPEALCERSYNAWLEIVSTAGTCQRDPQRRAVEVSSCATVPR